MNDKLQWMQMVFLAPSPRLLHKGRRSKAYLRPFQFLVSGHSVPSPRRSTASRTAGAKISLALIQTLIRGR